MSDWKKKGLTASLVGLTAMVSGTVHADVRFDERYVSSPAALIGEQNVYGEVVYDLSIEMIEDTIYNPTTDSDDPVMLRAYVGALEGRNSALVAPLIRMEPGQTIRMTLDNNLPEEDSCINNPGYLNTPHCFNGTNMHTHGLWINPAGNSDNVLLQINPGVEFQYEYNVPPDHPAGTFWYHPHLHGSTALQVGSGMAGALIITGDRQPIYHDDQLHRPGDLDLLLKDFEEGVLVLQQIPYGCFDEKGNLQTDEETGAWVCKPGQKGEVRDYNSQFGPSSWDQSGRYTTINGEVLPTAIAKAGDVNRLRVIHAGVRDTIAMRFRKFEGDEAVFDPKTDNMADWVAAHCTGEALDYHLVASDGLTMHKAVSSNAAVLQPGYRWDMLVQFPETGPYCLLDAAMPSRGAINENAMGRTLLGMVEVEPSDQPPASVTEQLVDAAERNIDPSVRARVIAQLEEGLRLDAFVPHKPLIDLPAEDFGAQELAFNIFLGGQGGAVFGVANTLNPKDATAYQGDRIDRDLVLGSMDEWTLTSGLAAHPFHIHVNPFQVAAIYNPDGVDVSGPDAEDVTMQELPSKDNPDQKEEFPVIDPQYRGMKGLWKDTIMVKEGYKVVMRTHYQRYVGDFVLHCHILDHEDQGMMQNVRISLPNGKGGTAHGHH